MSMERMVNVNGEGNKSIIQYAYYALKGRSSCDAARAVSHHVLKVLVTTRNHVVKHIHHHKLGVHHVAILILCTKLATFDLI